MLDLKTHGIHFETTYQELKQAEMYFSVRFRLYFETTYQELKLNGHVINQNVPVDFETTYQELKLNASDPPIVR